MNRMSVSRRAPGLVRCAGDPEQMFPVDESGPGQAPTVGERAALAVCAGCPVLDRCRVAVLAMPLAYGVAGGLTAGQRRELRAARLDRRVRAA